MFKQLLLSVATALTLLQPSYLSATSSQNVVNQTMKKETWLGLRTGSIPNVLRSQLSAVIPAGQGVMVIDVIDNSPAAKAGLQKNDVILNSDDQKIYSPQQLTGLVKSSKVNTSLKLDVVRQGEVRNISVVLGQRDKPVYSNMQWPSFGSHFGQDWLNQAIPNMPSFNYKGKGQPLSSWDSFESVQVKTLSDGRYHAEVKFKDPQGNEKGFTFEGKREEIIEQINHEKDLPEDKKQALLNSLKMDSGNFFNHPFFQRGNPFNDPFFTPRSLFNDPFFQHSFPRLNIPEFQSFFNNPSDSEHVRQKDFF